MPFDTAAARTSVIVYAATRARDRKPRIRGCQRADRAGRVVGRWWVEDLEADGRVVEWRREFGEHDVVSTDHLDGHQAPTGVDATADDRAGRGAFTPTSHTGDDASVGGLEL